MKSKIAVTGTPVSSGNRGVLALGASLVNLCWESSGGGEVVLLLNNRDGEPARFRVGGESRLIPVVPARLSPRARLRDHLIWILLLSVLYRIVPLGRLRRWIIDSSPWIRVLAEADLVGDVRGGDSFSDIYGLKNYLIGSIIPLTAVLVRGSIVQFPQTYGPYKSWIARRVAKWLLRRSAVIIARDKASQRVAQELTGSEVAIWLSPDVAFSLAAVRPERIDFNPPKSRAASKCVIGLNVNGLMYHGGYTRNNMFGLKLDYAKLLPLLVKALLAEGDVEIWLVPHTYAHASDVESDPEASRQLRDSLPADLQERVHLLAGEHDQNEIKGVIGLCDFFIGSRMHACIAALSQGIPCVGIAYSMKFAGVFETVGMKEWVIDGRETGNDAAVEMIVRHFGQRNSVRQALAASANAAREELKGVFKRLMEFQTCSSRVALQRIANSPLRDRGGSARAAVEDKAPVSEEHR